MILLLKRTLFPFCDVLDRDGGLNYMREPRKVWAMVTDGPTTAVPVPLYAFEVEVTTPIIVDQR